MATRPDTHRQRRSQCESLEARVVMTTEWGAIPIQHWVAGEIVQQIEDQPEWRLDTSLADAHGQTGLDQVRNAYGFGGLGQTVAIIDSGIAWDHLALGGGLGENYRVVGGWDFAERDANPYDDGPAGMHGTHVAGIVGASSGTNSGVAPEVDLVALRVFDDDGAGYFSAVEQALAWVHDHRLDYVHPITTVNLSLGASWNADTIPSWAMLEDELAALEQDGIFVAVAAGNAFSSHRAPGLSYPAASEHVVPVSAVTSSGTFSSFSQRHSRAIAAPGSGILSTAPDYAGNHNGRTDDWRALSGTSMAAPYVAGASVLLREAMQFVGRTNIVQDDLYDVMWNTADVFYDVETNANYRRLNLQAAIDSIMPSDEFGSTIATAHDLGALGGPLDVLGTIGRRDDSDYFHFTALQTGLVNVASEATHGMLPQWSVNGVAVSQATSRDDALSFSVVAGQSYTIGVSGGGALGHYAIRVSMDGSAGDVGNPAPRGPGSGDPPPDNVPAAEDLGSVEFLRQQVEISADGTRYSLRVVRGGYVTVTATSSAAQQEISIEIYRANGQRAAISNSSGTVRRADVQAQQGELLTVWVQGHGTTELTFANLVATAGDSVHVVGTAANDTFQFAVSDVEQVSVNGLSYTFTASAQRSYHIHGNGGSDSLESQGSAGDDRVTAGVGTFVQEGEGYHLAANSVETVHVVSGGGADLAFLEDSSGADRLAATPAWAELIGNGFAHRVEGFARVYAYASEGADTAVLQGSDGNDRLRAWGFHSFHDDSLVVLEGSGFFNLARGFQQVTAAEMGGVNTAYLYDSPTVDSFTATPAQATMVGNGFDHTVVGFQRVYAEASSLDDSALLAGSTGSDRYRSWAYNSTHDSQVAVLDGEGYYNLAKGFGAVEAVGMAGADTAELHGSRSHNRLVTAGSEAVYSGGDYSTRADGFEQMTVHATHEGDTAELKGSSGVDVFTAGPDRVQLSGPGYQHRVLGFAEVTAVANGGGDLAQLEGSEGLDTFTATGPTARLQGVGYAYQVLNFAQVDAVASGVEDVAYLHDTAGDDHLIGRPHATSLSGSESLNRANGFSRVYAYAGQGEDWADLHGGASDDRLRSWGFHATHAATVSVLDGSGYYQYVQGFALVTARAGEGNDTAYFYDAPSNDTFRASPDQAAMVGNGFDYRAVGFSRVYAYASNPGDVAILEGSTGNDRYRSWGYHGFHDAAVAVLDGADFYHLASGFGSVEANGMSGDDRAELHDSQSDDTLTARASEAIFSGGGYTTRARGFEQVDAETGQGGSDSLYEGTIDYLLTSRGTWQRSSR